MARLIARIAALVLPAASGACVPDAAAAAAAAPPLLTLALRGSALLPHPPALPARTFATLTGANYSAAAPLARDGACAFGDVPAGASYRAEVWTRDYVFAPLRVDVGPAAEGAGAGAGAGKRVEVWQTFHGHAWDDRGEKLADGQGGVTVHVEAVGQRQFYEERKAFSPMTLLQNPMILMGVVAMVVLVGMPKLLDNMDPEMKKEFEERQKQGPLAGASPMSGFDMAAWMAGSSSSAPATSSKTTATPSGGGGGKARRRG